MAKTQRKSDFSRTYEDILKSFIKDLNKQGNNYVYESLSEQHRLELLNILITESKKSVIPFMKHILGSDVFWFHKRWFENWRDYRIVCNVCSRGLGKSASVDTTRIFTKNGYLKHEDLKVGMEVLAYNEKTGKHEFKKIKHIIDNYTKPLYRVQMASGKFVDTSMDHPFLTVDGWKKLSDLEVGNFISTPRKLKHAQSRNDPIEELKILAYLITEGECTYSYKFSNQDLTLLNDVISCYDKIGIKHSGIKEGRISKSGMNYYVRPTSNKKYKNNIKLFAEKYNLYGNSYQKGISNKVGLNSLDKIAIFLGLLFECDGNLTKTGIQYASMSRDLMDDITTLLLYFGIHSRTREKIVKFNDKKFLSYQMNISGKDFIKFYENIKLISKQKCMSEIYNKMLSKNYNTNIDILPKEIVSLVPFKSMLQNKNNLTHYSLLQLKKDLELKMLKFNNGHGCRGIHKKTHHKYRYLVDNWEYISNRIDFFLNSENFWDEIKSIKFIGEQECFDLEIEGTDTHNFIANNINIHNTYFFTSVMPTWLAFSKPNYGRPMKEFHSLIIGYNDEEAKAFLGNSRNFIENNELLSNLIGIGANTDWNKSNLEMTNLSEIRARSFGGHLRGKHIKYIASDDLLNDDSPITPEDMRMKINQVILPMIRRLRGKFNIVGTLFSEDDIYHYFEEKSKSPLNEQAKMYCFFKLWVELDVENKCVYLCCYDTITGDVKRYLDTGISNIYDFEDLFFAQQDDPIGFLREYGCKIVSNHDVPFPIDMLNECKDERYSYKRIIPQSGTKYGSGLDFSNSQRKDSDETVLATGHFDDNENKIILDKMWSDNTLTVPERNKIISKQLLEFNNSYCLAEKNSMGETSIQYLNKQNNLKIEGFSSSREKKIDFIEYASVIIKKGDFILPYGDMMSKELTDTIIRQLSAFQKSKTKGGRHTYTNVAKHDDKADAIIFMLNCIFKNKKNKARIETYVRDGNTKITDEQALKQELIKSMF